MPCSLLTSFKMSRSIALPNLLQVGNAHRIPLRSVHRNFGVSLVLSNVPFIPIVVDGSFAAFTESQATTGEPRHKQASVEEMGT